MDASSEPSRSSLVSSCREAVAFYVRAIVLSQRVCCFRRMPSVRPFPLGFFGGSRGWTYRKSLFNISHCGSVLQSCGAIERGMTNTSCTRVNLLSHSRYCFHIATEVSKAE